jgi:hypothetical protein
LAVIAFVGQAIFDGKGPSTTSLTFALLLVGGAASILVHFGIRMTKAYINIIRFAAIERICLQYMLDDSEADSEQSSRSQYKIIEKTISEYHINWKSPISLGKMIKS